MAGLSLLPQDPSFALVVITIPTAPVLQKMQLKGVLVGQEQFAEWIRRAIISLQPGTQACFFFGFFFLNELKELNADATSCLPTAVSITPAKPQTARSWRSTTRC